ncbi:MAG: response regulator, partial [Desulfobacteraceae bacterium]|nr:response regulator [Desulfobacteraceae bacterium]
MKSRILIIDDEKFMLEMFKIIFNRNGYEQVSTVTEYSSMLADIAENKFDLIICDIILEKNTGIDFLKEMKNRNIKTPVILVTGKPEIQTAIDAVRLGAFDYMTKPIDMKCILDTTQKALEHSAEMERKQKREEENKMRLRHVIRTHQKHLLKMQKQIDAATDIYRELLKLNHKDLSIDISWQHIPLADLGGDFVDIREREDVIDIMVADVAGHDIGSSYHTILLKAFFEENCHKGNDGDTFFRILNQHILECGGNERMITAIFLRIHLRRMEMEMVCAAHPWITVMKKDCLGPTHLLESVGDVLGIYEDPVFISKQFQLASGDRIFVYTDG